MSLPFTLPQRKKILTKLLSWYKKDGRHDMPWRKTKDPYKIFVSEFMLQQTTVATVLPYYERFLKRFPDVTSLATAELDDVLSLWSGLGYYARARNLWSSARMIREKFRGKVPSETEQLIKLPGVGFYTAGAVSSLAFNRPAAVLDGNIIRVMMRLLSLEEDVKLKAVQVVLRKSALDLTTASLKSKKRSGSRTRGGPRDVVLALMDIGATVCLPRNPNCRVCPMSSECLAKKFGKQNEIPMPEEKLERPTMRCLYAIVQHEGRWLMGQRPKDGLFGGLWEFLGVSASQGVNPVIYLEETVEEEMGFPIIVKQSLPAFTHQLTHKIMIIRPYLCEVKGKKKKIGFPKKGAHYERFRWMEPSKSGQLGISSITKRIISQLGQKKLSGEAG